MAAEQPSSLSTLLPALPGLLLCLAGLAFVVRSTGRASASAGVPYWQPWRAWVVGILGGVFVLMILAMVAIAEGWIG